MTRYLPDFSVSRSSIWLAIPLAAAIALMLACGVGPKPTGAPELTEETEQAPRQTKAKETQPEPAEATRQLVRTFALNGYKRELDGQWQGIRLASDGNVYFASSSHSAHHGASFFKYDTTTGKVAELVHEITDICGEDVRTNPQGKIHSDIVEGNGWLYMATHFAAEKPGAYKTWTGAHALGYELATGITDHGLMVDQDGREVWRMPGMATDGRSHVYAIGDWWTVAGDLGSLRYDWKGGKEVYDQLKRGQFFAVADVRTLAPAAAPAR